MAPQFCWFPPFGSLSIILPQLKKYANEGPHFHVPKKEKNKHHIHTEEMLVKFFSKEIMKIIGK